MGLRAQGRHVLLHVPGNAPAVGGKWQHSFPREVVAPQPRGQGQGNGPAPVGGAHKHRVELPGRAQVPDEGRPVLCFDLPLYLLQQLGKNHRIGLGGKDLAKLRPGELLDGLGHPVGVPRVGVAHDQRSHPWAFPKLMHLASTSPVFRYS